MHRQVSIPRWEVRCESDTLCNRSGTKWHSGGCAERADSLRHTVVRGREKQTKPRCNIFNENSAPQLFPPSGQCWFLPAPHKSSARKTPRRTQVWKVAHAPPHVYIPLVLRASIKMAINWCRRWLPGFSPSLVDHCFFALQNIITRRLDGRPWRAIVLITRHWRCTLQQKRIISIITVLGFIHLAHTRQQRKHF